VPPLDRWVEEGLRPLPTGFAWERFRLEDRRVTPDGFVSFDGVLYGLPGPAGLTGKVVQVGVQQATLTIWAHGQVITHHPVRPVSGTQVLHPEQFTGVPPARTAQQAPAPCGHQVAAPAPTALQRPLAEYDQACGIAREEAAG
jgi:hypothetical protein